MMAALITPRLQEGVLDLEQQYVREYRWFFAALLMALAASLGKDLIITGKLPELPNLIAHGLFVLFAITALSRVRVACRPA